ncbi:endochitinase-like [Ornithodoros turicata]|uniref:endochitinase-like n=1 Tax=Ornithodoros turicata TaxID=34597 RepID=UPI003139EA3C
MTLEGNKRPHFIHDDPFVKNTCVYSISSCMILILVFFIVLPGALMPYLNRIRFIRQVPKLEDNSTEEPLSAGRPLIMCQVNPLSFTRKDPWRYSAQEIPVQLCSHLVLPVVGLGDFFSDLQNYDSLSLPPKPFHLDDFLRLRKTTPRLRLIMSVGTFHNASAFFYSVALSRDRIGVFARNLLRWLLLNNLDGIVLNGMFPAPFKMRNGMIRLLKRISTLFRHRELVLVLPPETELIKRPLAGQKLGHFFDYAVIPPMAQFDHVFQSGLPKTRIIAAIAFAGAHYSGDDKKGLAGSVPYYELCQRKGNASEQNKTTTVAPANPSFTDPDTLETHIAQLVLQDVAGFFVWDVSVDDVIGICGRKHVLLETVYNTSVTANSQRSRSAVRAGRSSEENA